MVDNFRGQVERRSNEIFCRCRRFSIFCSQNLRESLVRDVRIRYRLFYNQTVIFHRDYRFNIVSLNRDVIQFHKFSLTLDKDSRR